MEEVWRPVAGFEGYEISITGLPRSFKRGKEKILRVLTNKDGYCYTQFWKGKNIQFKIATLVALAFPEICGEYFEGAQVNHNDENKQNNCAYNLKWTTPKENSNHGTRNQRIAEKHKKPIIQKRLDGTTVFVWKSTKEASETGGFSITGICQALRKKQKTHKGFIWEYF